MQSISKNILNKICKFRLRSCKWKCFFKR